MNDFSPQPTIAVLIPCYNEAISIRKVVQDFKTQLPDATIYVFDNNSTDDTYALAAAAGAVVVKEKKQGKGFVVAAMLNKVSADYYIMVDGDDTYPAECVHELLQPLYDEKADMVVGQRLSVYSDKAFRNFHVFGNRLVCGLVNLIFSTKLTDPMSGYRAFTRDVAENLPIIAFGFDVETEMTLQMLYRRYVIHEVGIPYRARPENSFSKLNTYRDGFLVLVKILSMAKAYKPLTFFGSLAIIAAVLGIIIGAFPTLEFIQYHYIYSVPKAILAASLILLSSIFASIGLILNTMNFRLLEVNHVLSKQIQKATAAANKEQVQRISNRQ